ncbi:MAG TPA: A/G-specific adenine glycosylase [Sphingomonadaceae bacterium]|nr:A/G-specific adenine glycosylase [Sphingomonadaceae bacterium]
MLASVPSPAGARLLAWYDAHARPLPWRTPPNPAGPRGADPYRVWLSEIMLQQTTVAAVIPYYQRFTARWPTVEALAAAADAEVMTAWAGLGYYARARNLLACARAVVRDHGGRFPVGEAALRTLPGIGGYTAAAIAAIAQDQPAVVVDGNVERVVARLFAIPEPLPAARRAIAAAATRLTPTHRHGDYAQAMMDLGATICRPRAPLCLVCPLAAGCATREAGNPETYRRKAAKAPRPARRASAYVLQHGGEVYLERRPARGLLGGMNGFPADPPAPADWRKAGEVAHVFTHFGLTLDVFHAAAPRDADARPDGLWWPVADIAGAGLPTLFRKVAASVWR